MSKLILRIDFDDVINNLSDYWINYHYEQTGEVIKNYTWDIHEKSKHGSLIYQHLEDTDFFLNAPMKIGVYSLFEFLSNNATRYDYNIVSACNFGTEETFEYVRMQKIEWLQRHLPLVETSKFHLTNESKGMFAGDILLDDNLNYLNQGGVGKIKLLMTAPHNRRINVGEMKERSVDHIIKRVKEHSEVIDILRELLNEDFDIYVQQKFK